MRPGRVDMTRAAAVNAPPTPAPEAAHLPFPFGDIGMRFGMTMAVIVSGVLFFRGASGEAADRKLASGGATEYSIAVAAQPTAAESFAAQELAEFLKKATGATFPVVKEADLKGGKALYVGQTEFARQQKIDFTALKAEEWVIRDADGSMILSGGRPRGTLYGVYEFLEKVVGVRFLSNNNEFIPAKQELSIPGDLKIQAMPTFQRREIFMLGGGGGQGQWPLFQVRRKLNGNNNEDPRYGFNLRIGSPRFTHTHQDYTQNFPADHPEYFALLENGGRAANGSDGQVCLTNAEVRSLFVAKLREYIKQDRQAVLAAGKGEPPPTIYSLELNDNSHKCVCPGCMALARKYGAYSGVVIDFTNAIAENIAKDYPEIVIKQAAYTFHMDAPKDIRPRDNVIIYMALLGAEFNTPPLRDTLRGITNPVNAKPRAYLESWAATGSALGTHDYATPWNQPYLWPHTSIHGLAQTIKLYHRCNMKHYFVEDELFGSRIHNFVDLQFYLTAKLLQAPTQDEQPIIDEFMALYYGPAAPAMQKLLAYIEKRQDEESGPLSVVPPDVRKYFDAEFFIQADAMISEAERLAADNPTRLANIRQERVGFDEASLYLWERLNRQKPLPFKRDAVLARLEQGYQAAYRKYGGWGEAMKKDDTVRLEYLKNMPSVPEQFAGKNIVDVAGPRLDLGSGGGRGYAKVVEDPDAATGKCWRLTTAEPGACGQHSDPPTFGFYDEASKVVTTTTIELKDIPKDEKYHIYKVGRVKASSNLIFWAHFSWRMAQRLSMLYNASLPEQKLYDVYISLKLEGPGYVPGSTKTGAFSVDRIIAVEATNP